MNIVVSFSKYYIIKFNFVFSVYFLDGRYPYIDPVHSASPSFQQRLTELAALESDTIRYERTKRIKKRSKQENQWQRICTLLNWNRFPLWWNKMFCLAPPVKIYLWKSASELAATARFPRRHAVKYRTSLATPLVTAVAVDVDANSDTAEERLK